MTSFHTHSPPQLISPKKKSQLMAVKEVEAAT